MLRIIGAGLLVVIAAMAILLITPQEKASLKAAVNAGPSHVLDWAQETASRRLGLNSDEEMRGGQSTSIAVTEQTAREDASDPMASAAATQAPIPPSQASTAASGHAGEGQPDPQMVSSVPSGNSDSSGTGFPSSGPDTETPPVTQASGTPVPQAVVSSPPPSASPTTTPSNAAGATPTSSATPTGTATVPPPAVASATPTATPPPAAVVASGDAASAAALLAAINEARAAEGLPALRPSSTLGTIVASHASDLAAQRRLSHDGSDGSTLGQRLNRGGAGCGTAGENVARGRGGAAGMPEVAQAFLASPVHRANLLNPAFEAAGLAVIQEADGTSWITVVFTD